MNIFLTIQSVVQRSVAVGIMLAAWVVTLPAFVHAADTTCQSGRLCNPLRFPSIETFIQGVLQAIVLIGVPVITLFIVYAGFKFVLARGKPGEISKAKDNFVWVILGAALILGAWVLATLIGGTVSQLLGGGSGSLPASSSLGPF